MQTSVLVVDDDIGMCELLVDDLARRGFHPLSSTRGEDALRTLHTHEVDLVITDLNMPGMNGLELCQDIRQNWPEIPVIILTAFGSMDSAVAAMRADAFDFITKPIELDLLAMTIGRALKHRALEQKIQKLSEKVEKQSGFDQLIGSSAIMEELRKQIQLIARSNSSVLITGETGTGKELIARSIHSHSPRANFPFVAINCSALPETLMESELFGINKGAFTDARQDRKGLLLEADRGSFFLDEIGEIPLSLQVKLLRVLEQRTVRPIGGNQERPFNVRIISATHRDLEQEIREGRFREDLYYRLNVIQLNAPTLRNREGDILILAQKFLELFAQQAKKNVTGLSDPVMEKLFTYSWPGNVRELKNVIERAVALTAYEKIKIQDLPEKIKDFSKETIPAPAQPEEILLLDEVERRYILQTLQLLGGNRSLASKKLGLDRKTLYRKLQKYGLES